VVFPIVFLCLFVIVSFSMIAGACGFNVLGRVFESTTKASLLVRDLLV
jgi:Trk-type K+ transport system membrane component